MQWNTLDSPGHLHEVLAGNFFHEETESVPEQTWSSAGLLDSTVRGLLGLEISGGANHLRLTPHLPADWDQVSVDNIRLPHSTVSVKLIEDESSVELAIRNEGVAFDLVFEPQIPLGARLLGADLNNTKIDTAVETFSGDEHAKVSLRVPSGVSHFRLRFEGGVALIMPAVDLHVGDPSSQPKIIRLSLQQHVLSIRADVLSGTASRFRIRTPWTIASHQGVTVRSLPPNEYELEMTGPSTANDEIIGPTGYVHAACQLTFTSK